MVALIVLFLFKLELYHPKSIELTGKTWGNTLAQDKSRVSP